MRSVAPHDILAGAGQAAHAGLESRAIRGALEGRPRDGRRGTGGGESKGMEVECNPTMIGGNRFKLAVFDSNCRVAAP